MAKSGILIGQWSGADATNALHKSIREFNEATAKQTRQLVFLTWAIAFLTLAMTVGVGVQIWIAWPS